MTPEELELAPARLTLGDLSPQFVENFARWYDRASERFESRRRRRIWRRDNSQSVLMLSVMGAMWSDWQRWGLVGEDP